MFLIVANKPLSDNAISVIYIYKCFILNTHNFSTVIGFKVELSIQQRSICNIKLATYAVKISIAQDVIGNCHKKTADIYYVRFKCAGQKIRRKNLHQNENDIVEFLVKDFDCDVDGANELADKAVDDNTIKLLSFKFLQGRSGRNATQELVIQSKLHHLMVKSFYRAVPEETQHGTTVLEPAAMYDLEETDMAIERDKVAGKSTENDDGKFEKLSRNLKKSLSVFFLKPLKNAF